ncbi:MAG: hypothetical protein M0Z31_12405 [Clostridia bacterium]|nr:hypothetical protein [Clostridia bacterium]
MGFRRSKTGRGARFFHWAEKIERVLFRLVLVGMALVLVGQVMDSENPWDSVIALTSLNNDPVLHSRELPSKPDEVSGGQDGERGYADLATVTLQLENFSSLAKAKIIVNGREVGNFTEKLVSVKVRPGDLLEVDGSFYQQAIRVKVLDTSPIIKRPEEGGEFLVRSGITQLGKVKFGNQR